MYLVDFASRLARKQNIGIIIYLILNLMLISVLFSNFFIGLVVYAISLCIALSPAGEWILRVQQGCKPLVRKEHKERLLPLFNEVYEKAKAIDPNLPDNIKLFISPDKEPNAFATGRKTICVTKGLLQFSDEEIKATLAHEFGHLSNKDTDLILVVAVGNMIVTILFVLYRVFFAAIGIGAAIANRSLGSLITSIFIDLVLVALMWVWTKIGVLLVMHSSRKNEHEADRFAYQCGYGSELIELLDHFDEVYETPSKGLWANLAASHPANDLRIGFIQNLDGVKAV